MKQVNASVIIFYDDKGNVLLQDREGYSKWGEEWAIPGGGAEQGETPEQTLIREVKEECCYDITDHVYLGKTEYHFPTYHFTQHVFVAPLQDKQTRFTVMEGAGHKLYSISEARKLKMPDTAWAVLDMVEEYLNASSGRNPQE